MLAAAIAPQEPTSAESTAPPPTDSPLTPYSGPVALSALPAPTTGRFPVPRPHAMPYRRRLDAFLEAYIALAPSGSAFRAAQVAGWKGAPLLVMHRADRVLARQSVQRELERRLRERLASIRTPSVAEVMSELGHVGMRRGPEVDMAWWLTGAKVKALELLAKHYGALTDVLAVRDMPKTVSDASRLLALELQRIGAADSVSATPTYALPEADAAPDDALGASRSHDLGQVHTATRPMRGPDTQPEHDLEPSPAPQPQPKPDPSTGER